METKKKVLVVEDEEPLRKILQDKLTEHGFAVTLAKDGQEGLETAIKEHPNIILLDLMMPNMDGEEMLKMLRNEHGEYGKNVPVVILTNYNDSSHISLGKEFKVSHFWVKSDWNIDDLAKEIKGLLEIMEKIYPQH